MAGPGLERDKNNRTGLLKLDVEDASDGRAAKAGVPRKGEWVFPRGFLNGFVID